MIDLIHIQNQILTYLHGGQYAHESLERDTDLIESGLLDSMLVMDLAHFIESQYSISLEPTDITPRNLRTVTDMARCIAGKARQEKLRNLCLDFELATNLDNIRTTFGNHAKEGSEPCPPHLNLDPSERRR